jgi:hypothetical protein
MAEDSRVSHVFPQREPHDCGAFVEIRDPTLIIMILLIYLTE